MDFKVLIKCEVCKCRFEFRPEHFKDRENLQCPNCNQEFPKGIFQKLRFGMLSLGEVPDKIAGLNASEGDIFQSDGFSMEVTGFSELDFLMGKG